jgi:hypothetical protein
MATMDLSREAWMCCEVTVEGRRRVPAKQGTASVPMRDLKECIRAVKGLVRRMA